jgi:hypothetical protein
MLKQELQTPPGHCNSVSVLTKLINEEELKKY